MTAAFGPGYASAMIGVCSWSLQPHSPEELAHKVRQAGLSAIQIALDPLRIGDWNVDATLAALHSAGIAIRSGMLRTCGEDYTTLESIRQTGGVRPDEHWLANIAAARENARLARILGVNLVTFHAGFIPEQRGHAVRTLMIQRLREMIDCLGEHGVCAAFETGQETAETLLDALAELDRPTVGVNFDPANMLLYGMGDPVAALQRLAPRIKQVHLKDAIASDTLGDWGRETPLGRGQVDWPAFFRVLEARNVRCDLMIERESGGSRLDEIRAAANVARTARHTE
ncbi:MAG: sugar phosphate isomerase/epimerase family protein [Phycisphaerae bacterium]